MIAARGDINPPEADSIVTLPSDAGAENIRIVSGQVEHRGEGAAIYTVIGSFFGGAAGGAWLGLVLLSLPGLYGYIPLWKDLLAGTLAIAVITALAVLCSRAAGRLAGLRIVLVAVIAALNLAAVLYLFGDWVCEVSSAGPAFTNCRIPTPLGGLTFIYAALLVSPSVLAAVFGATVTVRGLLQNRSSHRRSDVE